MNLAIIQARMASTRLPGKVLLPLGGKPMLERMIERVRRARLVDRLVVATTTEPEDEAIADLCDRMGVPCYRGDEDDVLRRFDDVYNLYARSRDDTIIRLTGDCPFSDPEVIDLVIEEHGRWNADLTVNTGPGGQGYPDGLDVEAIEGPMLALANERAGAFCPSLRPGVGWADHMEREHVTLWFRRHPDLCRVTYCAHVPGLSGHKWSVDTPADYRRVGAIFEALHPTNPEFGMNDILEWEARSGGR